MLNHHSRYCSSVGSLPYEVGIILVLLLELVVPLLQEVTRDHEEIADYADFKQAVLVEGLKEVVKVLGDLLSVSLGG